MKRLTTATLNWFDDGCCDVKYLDIWHDAPLNYAPGKVTADAAWITDRYEHRLARQADDALFQAAADRLMRYQFYPDDVMAHYGDFDLEERWAQVGDRIIQRIRVLRPFGWPVLDAVSMTEVTAVVHEPRRVGFTYVTTARHAAQGEWSILLERRDNGDLILTIHAKSCPAPGEPARNHALMRRLQQRAHRRGIEHFTAAVQATRETAVG